VEQIRAAFFDIDGTLVSLTRKVYAASARAAVARLRERGVLCFVATGRSIFEIREESLLDGMEFDGYLTNNGQVVYDGQQRFLFGQPLDPADVAAVLDWAQATGTAHWLVSAEQTILSHGNAWVDEAMAAIHTRLPRFGDISALAQEPIYKIVLFCTARQLQQAMARTKRSRKAQWHPLGHDILSIDGGKQRAMEQMLACHGLLPSQAIAFGDGENDIEMLRCAGIGVAMGNGSPAVKAAADHIAPDTDDDGIWRALHHFGLLPEAWA